MHGWIDAAGHWNLPGIAQLVSIIPIVPIVWRVERLDWNAGPIVNFRLLGQLIRILPFPRAVGGVGSETGGNFGASFLHGCSTASSVEIGAALCVPDRVRIRRFRSMNCPDETPDLHRDRAVPPRRLSE